MGLETSTITFLAKYLRSSKIQIVVLVFSRVTLLTVFEPRNKKNFSVLFYTTLYYLVLTMAKVK